MSVGRIARYLLVVAFGYAVAVTVATVVSIILMAVVSGFALSMRGMPDLLIGGGFFTAMFGSPGFVVAIFLAARLGWRRARTFAIAGLANTFLALLLFGAHSGGGLGAILQFLLPCPPGGLAGGLAYWIAAGRFLVSPRQPA